MKMAFAKCLARSSCTSGTWLIELVNMYGWQFLNLCVFPWAARSVNERQVSLGKRGEKGVAIGAGSKCQPMVGHLCLLPVSSELCLRYVYVFKLS